MLAYLTPTTVSGTTLLPRLPFLMRHADTNHIIIVVKQFIPLDFSHNSKKVNKRVADMKKIKNVVTFSAHIV
jgi:hypothetical protein